MLTLNFLDKSKSWQHFRTSDLRQIIVSSLHVHISQIARSIKGIYQLLRPWLSQNKRCRKNKTKLTVRMAFVCMSCTRSVKYFFFDYYALLHHVSSVLPSYRPPTWFLLVTGPSTGKHCLLGHDAPCSLSMSQNDPIFSHSMDIMIVDRINPNLATICVDYSVIYDVYQNNSFLTSRKMDFFG